MALASLLPSHLLPVGYDNEKLKKPTADFHNHLDGKEKL